jgi:hypothetical protein
MKTSDEAWAIVHERGLLNKNWLLNKPREYGEKEAWPGMFNGALFGTRAAARAFLRSEKGNEVSVCGPRRVVRVTLRWSAR